ncbi:hypothetical protein J3Q64DRAFT_1694943 [Phycomyces blakesleeanus]|uniref:Uncharacterized protein n=2 Tax=Phycomyces blakesleeanus TaxID=4837 RepID=A0A163B773_PHYB8|nr:hypothetical protein PHYBLDRAFT_163713 [Phycomyces blakesleeanus NRRL 1555(-)]OAD78611.1 hypothetical protein PHYBLDRAFT_163713 [Phycomyces blakesleeanus NRRL 1555(-)]|eukprot:XP_018296651.1 hypothetical protein PHYBLDRAFT_163713 [Phycomyces blakesleeanus NRRL 1555(-)]
MPRDTEEQEVEKEKISKSYIMVVHKELDLKRSEFGYTLIGQNLRFDIRNYSGNSEDLEEEEEKKQKRAVTEGVLVCIAFVFAFVSVFVLAFAFVFVYFCRRNSTGSCENYWLR